MTKTFTPGEVQNHRGQDYEFVGAELYTNRHGVEIELLVWQTKCADCGAPFRAKTTAAKFEPSRRCQAHKAPLRKVQA